MRTRWSNTVTDNTNTFLLNSVKDGDDDELLLQNGCRRKALSLISSQNHGQGLSPLQISDTP